MGITGICKLGVGREFAHKLVDSLVGDDGKIRYTEFMARMIASQRSLQSSEMAGIFQKMDLDGSGTLSKDELREVLKQKNMESLMHGRDADDLLNEMDLNGDGVIGFS